MDKYTVGTITRQRGMLGTKRETFAVKALFCNGVPVMTETERVSKGIDESLEDAADYLNRRETENAAYRAQFATEEEWMQHLDENAAG